MVAIADDKNAARASECSFGQYSKDAVNCVTKKVRKYRKKLDKIAQTEKLDHATLNKEQREMIRAKNVRFVFVFLCKVFVFHGFFRPFSIACVSIG